MGGVPQSKASQASRSLTISADEVPYNYTPLTSNLYISSDLTDKRPILYIDNMCYYAKNNIPNYTTITSIPEEHSPNSINTSLAQDWSYTFYDCENLISLPDPFYDTSNAINMNYIFGYCGNLATVPNFDTSNVTNMVAMFSGCSNLTTIPNFDTGNVTNMGAMFSSCSNLTTVPNFDTSNVTSMHRMFSYCNNLTTIPNFDTSNVTSMYSMFSHCTNLTTLPDFDTSNVTSMTEAFNFCNNLTTIPIFNTTKLIGVQGMFAFCYKLKGDLYIISNNIQNAFNVFTSSGPTKNIYVHANSNTYRAFFNAMNIKYGENYSNNWHTYLKTMENSYANISPNYNTSSNNTVYENGTIAFNKSYKFPTNKIALLPRTLIGFYRNAPFIEITPFKNYNLTFYQYSDNTIDIYHDNILWGKIVQI